MEILSCSNLIKTYQKQNVVNNLGFSVIQGKALALRGSNGAGKTTTINMILDLIKKDGGMQKIPRQKLRNQIPLLMEQAGLENGKTKVKRHTRNSILRHWTNMKAAEENITASVWSNVSCWMNLIPAGNCSVIFPKFWMSGGRMH